MKSVVITGTSRGLGEFLARRYLAAGWRVFGCSRGVAAIDSPDYAHFQLDVADDTAVAKMLKEVKKRGDGIDALINNAGVAAMNHIATTPYRTAKRVFEANFFGTFLFCREAGKIMMRQRRGSIVNFTTVATPLRLQGEAVYAASKAAVESFTRVCAMEFAGYGVRVNAVGPGPVKTQLIKGVPPVKIQALLNRLAVNDYGEPKDVGKVVDFFLDDENRLVTGQIVYLGGA